MPKGPLFPSEFVPTKVSSAADKVEFGNALPHHGRASALP